MANITRYDPFNLDSVFDDFFKGFLVRPMALEGVPKAPEIKMDVTENDKAYTVKAEIPGVKKEDIHVSVDGNTVSISAEVKKESEEKEGEKVLRSERYFGRVARSFSLGSDIDEANATAKYTDGVLELVLPKKAASSAKRLTIS
ncbi:Hsp20/alpha crystallin family protein [Thiobacter aerophilum]|uniref:Hsp20 family protein n=1 Tax=Thiobacter aerophilum TaxID=3121275 RepID=A0ABV0EHD4_9BURK